MLLSAHQLTHANLTVQRNQPSCSNCDYYRSLNSL